MSSTTPQPDKNWKPVISSEDDFTRTLEHAKFAYENTQEVIKLLDSKCNIMIALTSAASGLALSLAKWNFELALTSKFRLDVLGKDHPWVSYLIIGLFAFSLLGTLACVAASVCSIIARKPKHGGFTVLFPLPRDLDQKEAECLLQSHLAGMTREGVIREFAEQLATVGRIAQKKMAHCRFASRAVLAQIFLLTVAVGLYFFLAVRLM